MNFCSSSSTTSLTGVARTRTAEFFFATPHQCCTRTLHRIKISVFQELGDNQGCHGDGRTDMSVTSDKALVRPLRNIRAYSSIFEHILKNIQRICQLRSMANRQDRPSIRPYITSLYDRFTPSSVIYDNPGDDKLERNPQKFSRSLASRRSGSVHTKRFPIFFFPELINKVLGSSCNRILGIASRFHDFLGHFNNLERSL
jgi:hypothetical protein